MKKKCLVPSAWCRVPGAREVGRVINRQESYQQAPASSPKKAEGKRDLSPCTPYREKGRGKKQDGVISRGFQDRAPARAHARRQPCTCTYTEAGEAALEIVDNCFPLHAKDIGLWAWYCRHFDRRMIVEKAYYYASCRGQNEVRDGVRAFQSWLCKEFGTKGGRA